MGTMRQLKGQACYFHGGGHKTCLELNTQAPSSSKDAKLNIIRECVT